MRIRTNRFAAATLQAAADARDQRREARDDSVLERFEQRLETPGKSQPRTWLDEQWERVLGNAS